MFRFWDSYIFWDILAFVFKKQKQKSFGVKKGKYPKIRDRNFAEFSILRLWRFWLHFTSNLRIKKVFEHYAFLPQMAKHNVTKTPFSQTFLYIF